MKKLQYYVVDRDAGISEGPFDTIKQAQTCAEDHEFQEPVVCQALMQGKPRSCTEWKPV